MKFNAIPWGLKRLCKGSKQPKYLVRLCRNLGEFEAIVNEARNCTNKCWQQDLIERVIRQVLGSESSGVSTYNADTIHPFDVGHALGVIAEGISSSDFHVSKGKKRKSTCTKGSLIIPVTCFPKTTHYEFTPKNNLNFYPANHRHFDLSINDAEELATVILDGIRDQTIKYTFIKNDLKTSKLTYHLQAVIAYSHCLQVFGNLNHSEPPSSWSNGKTLTVSEQIETLQHLAQVQVVP